MPTAATTTEGFYAWLAGAGVKRGFSYGATDEFGYQAVENPTSVYELHATILHLLGLDYEKLSFFYNGAEQRLTFVQAGDQGTAVVAAGIVASRRSLLPPPLIS